MTDTRTVTVDTTPRQPMFTVQALAAYLAVSVRTVRRLIDAGEVEAIQLAPQTVRVSAESVEAYLGRCRDNSRRNAA